MFSITRQQLSAFSEVCSDDFAEQIASHLGETFPERCEELGASGVRDLARKGVERAASHGITAEVDVCLFADLMCALGEDFDANPSMPWAAEILGAAGRVSPSETVDRLCDAAATHLESEGEEGAGEEGAGEEGAGEEGAAEEGGEAAAPGAAASGGRSDFAERLLRAAQARFQTAAPVAEPIVACPEEKRLYWFSM